MQVSLLSIIPYGNIFFSNHRRNRLSFIGKEKDVETALSYHSMSGNLADHGVRKSRRELKNSVTLRCEDFSAWSETKIPACPEFPSGEKYYGWSPYHYCMNNPVNRIDRNGMWVKEVSDISHVHSGKVKRNSNGYLAKELNYRIYNEWVNNAPKMAQFLEYNSIFVLQTQLPNDNYALGELGGNTMWFDLSQDEAINDLAGNALHETIHLLGYGEFEAYGSLVSAGYWTKNDLIYQINNSRDIQVGIFEGKRNLFDNWLSGEVSTSEIVDQMVESAEPIIKEAD